MAAYTSIPALDVACPGCGHPIRLTVTCANRPRVQPDAVTVVLSVDEEVLRADIDQHMAKHHPDPGADAT